MSGKASSRWADDEEDAALEAQKKKEREEKKRAKAEKQRKLDIAAEIQQRKDEAAAAALKASEGQSDEAEPSLRPAKRRRLSHEEEEVFTLAKLLRFPAPEWKKCRSVENYDKLNDIEEGAYGWVSRAKDMSTGKVVALKRLKMDNAADGIPVTGLREIQTLMDCDHPNIIKLQEVVVGENTEKIEK